MKYYVKHRGVSPRDDHYISDRVRKALRPVAMSAERADYVVTKALTLGYNPYKEDAK